MVVIKADTLRSNVAANYASQAFVAAAGLLTVPVYIKLMGAEAFGLIGFNTLLQAWFMMLDTGLTAALARQASLYNGGEDNADLLAALKKVLERVFTGIGAAGALVFIVLGPAFARDWLQLVALDEAEVARAIGLIGVVVALRWQSALYRGAITGFERQVWLGGANAVIAALRFLLPIPLLAFVDNGPVAFFGLQVAVALLEMLVMRHKARSLMPRVAGRAVEWRALRPVMTFSAGIALTSIIWVLVTQSDKLILSRLLPLTEFGHYSMAVQLAMAITLLNTPFTTAILPSMTRIHAGGDPADLMLIFRRATQLVTLAVAPATIVLVALGREVLVAWTGDAALAADVAPVLGLYATGNALMAIAALSYYLQYAYGNVRLHIRGQLIFALLYLPLLAFGVHTAGAVGAGWCWAIANCVYLVLWSPLAVRSLTGSGIIRWLTLDIAVIIGAAALPALAMLAWHPETSRFEGLALACLLGVISLGAGLAAASLLRGPAVMRWQMLVAGAKGSVVRFKGLLPRL
jgi:O-antigen/teichoic acid export membrane protein